MSAPSLTVVDNEDKTITRYDFGVIQANKASNVVELKIYNNRGGSTSISDLRDANITVLDIDNKATSDFIVNKWMGVKCPSVDGNIEDFTRVGGTIVKQIRADGLSASDGYTISGAANNGNYSDSLRNVSTVYLCIFVPENAVAATKSAKIRIQGSYS